MSAEPTGLPSTKPYLLRALWEWCCDNGFTPHIVVVVDQYTRVPREHVRDGQIVLNIGQDATGHLKIGNELIEFQARFGGVARQLSVPIGQVVAIYARENGAGMAFELETSVASASRPSLEVIAESSPAPSGQESPPPSKPAGGRPGLKRIK